MSAAWQYLGSWLPTYRRTQDGLGAGEGAVQEEPCHCESDDDSSKDAEPSRRRAVDAASLRAAEVLLVAHAPLAAWARVAELAALAGAARSRQAEAGRIRLPRTARAAAVGGGVALVNLGGEKRGAPVAAWDAERLEGSV